MPDPFFASLSELARKVAAREISSVELVDLHLRRIDAVNAALNAVVTRCDEQALKQAALADAAVAAGEPVGPLHGVPFTVKDAFDTAGVLSTGGTMGRASYVPPASATVVERLADAGAILVGKTNTSELTLSYETDNLIFGPTFNPYDPSRSPGGSSGGSAAIVAAGGSPLDIGSDTGGSIRLPAHFCGVAGIKPTAGRVPRSGLIVPGGVPTDALTQVGPIARFVDDLTLVMPIISGVDWRDAATIPMPRDDVGAAIDIATLRVAHYTNNGELPVLPEVAAVVRGGADALAERGAAVTEARPPGIEETRSIFGSFFGTDGAAWVRRILAEAGTRDVSPGLAWAMEGGGEERAERPASAFIDLLRAWNEFRVRMLSFMRAYDAILAPVHAYPALPGAELLGDERKPAFGYAQAYNLTGWPVVTVRAGTSATGLPIGVQVVARPWREDIALALARELERSLGGWQAPPAHVVRG